MGNSTEEFARGAGVEILLGGVSIPIPPNWCLWSGQMWQFHVCIINVQYWPAKGELAPSSTVESRTGCCRPERQAALPTQMHAAFYLSIV